MRVLFAVFLAASTPFLDLAHAEDLKTPIELESTQVLPRGVRNPRLKNLIMFIDSRYGANGAVEPLGNQLNQSVTWQTMIASQKTTDDQEMLKGLLLASHIGDWDKNGPGSTTGVVNTYVNAKVPVLAFGVTDHLTLALAVPVIKVEVGADTGYVSRNTKDTQSFFDSLCASNPVKCNQIKAQLQDATNQKLTAYGYESIHSQTVSGIGDVKLVSKYLFRHNEKNDWTLKGELTFPTGIRPNPDKALDVPTGDGRYAFSKSLIWDHKILPALTWNTYGGYTAFFSNHVVKRIPTVLDALSPDKEELKRKMGHLISGGTSLSYRFLPLGLSLGLGYGVQYLSQTQYEDGAFQSDRYRLLEEASPAQLLHTSTLMAGFSTVEMYQAGGSLLPFQANLAWSHPLSGKNVPKNDLVMGELVLFF